MAEGLVVGTSQWRQKQAHQVGYVLVWEEGVCVCVCVCVHLFCAYVFACVCVCVHVCTSYNIMCVHVFMCVYVPVYMCMCVQAQVRSLSFTENLKPVFQSIQCQYEHGSDKGSEQKRFNEMSSNGC